MSRYTDATKVGITLGGNVRRLHPDPSKRRKLRTHDTRLDGKKGLNLTQRIRARQDTWSASIAARGWRIFYPRDPELDGPSNLPPGAPPPSRAQRVNPPEPLPPGDDAPAAEWAEWEQEELRSLAGTVAWRKLAASAKSSAGLRKRARMLRLLGGRPLMLVARASGLERSTFGRILRGRREPSFAAARRIARALKVDLETLGRYLDRVRSDPF